jgi:hypothetical protein
MAYIIPKRNNLMDVHMKKWRSYGKTRLSVVSFSSDPVPQCIDDVDILNLHEQSSDYIMIPSLSINTAQDVDDTWSIVWP